MDRTEELRKAGAKKLGGGGNHPFVKWDDSHAYVEGELLRLWESNYGWCGTVAVHDVSPNLQAKMDKDTPAVMIERGDTVNVSLNYAALKESLREDHIGHSIHVAFVGWEQTKAGQKYRLFELYDIGEPEPEFTEEELEGDPDDLPF